MKEILRNFNKTIGDINEVINLQERAKEELKELVRLAELIPKRIKMCLHTIDPRDVWSMICNNTRNYLSIGDGITVHYDSKKMVFELYFSNKEDNYRYSPKECSGIHETAYEIELMYKIHKINS